MVFDRKGKDNFNLTANPKKAGAISDKVGDEPKECIQGRLHLEPREFK